MVVKVDGACMGAEFSTTERHYSRRMQRYLEQTTLSQRIQRQLEIVRDVIDVDEQMDEFIKLCQRHENATQYQLELLNKHGFVHLMIFMLTSEIFLDHYLYDLAIQLCVRFMTEKNVGCFHAVIPTMVKHITELEYNNTFNTPELFLCRFIDYAPSYLHKFVPELKARYDKNGPATKSFFFKEEQQKMFEFVGHTKK